MTDYPDYQSPQAHATQIAKTGVPLLTASQSLSTGTLSIPSGQTSTIGPFTFSQIGWEMGLSYSAAVAAALPLRVIITWTDSVSALTTDIDTFGIAPGTVANPHVCRLFGRTKGDTVTAEFDNSATGEAATVSYTLLENSRVLARESYKTITWVPAGPTPALNFNVNQGIIAAGAPVVNAGSQLQRLLPAFDGLVTVFASTNSGTTDLDMFIQDLSAFNTIMFHEQSDSKGRINGVTSLPKSQCVVGLNNANVANEAVTVGITAQALA